MLEHFFGSKTRLKLLKVFFRQPTQAFYVRELARLIDTQLHAVRREIANLEHTGIIGPVAESEIPQREPGTERSKFYRLRVDGSLFPEMKALLLKGDLLREKELASLIQEKGGEIKLLVLTGIFKNDRDALTDMLIVGSLKPGNIARLIKDYEDETGRSIRYTLMEEKEFWDRREIGDRFIYEIFEASHDYIINELKIA